MAGRYAATVEAPDTERFRFEDDEAFRLALEIAERTDSLAMEVRRQRPWVSSQLGRSGPSVLNNTTEGIGEFSPGDKARLYRCACRSASETRAMIIFLARKGLADAAEELHLRTILLDLTKLFTRRARHFQQRARHRRRRP